MSALAEMFLAAQPGALRPRDLDTLAMMVGDSPHLAFPLRRIGDVTFALKLARGDMQKNGQIDIEKAMRETYPGATTTTSATPTGSSSGGSAALSM